MRSSICSEFFRPTGACRSRRSWKIRARIYPEQVVTVLAGEAFSRLDTQAQSVMQALGIYRYPCLPAVDHLLQPYFPGIDSARVLSRLVNMQFARRDAGRCYIHQVDRDYALSRLPKGTSRGLGESDPQPYTIWALRHRAADWFRSPAATGNVENAGRSAAQLSEFDLRCEGEEYNPAAALLREINYDYLQVWGHYALSIELTQRVYGKVNDAELAAGVAGNLAARTCGWKDSGGDRLYEEALRLSRQSNFRAGEASCLDGLGSCYYQLGDHTRAVEHWQKSLAISEEIQDKAGQSSNLVGMGIYYSETGRNHQAIECYQKALAIDRELGNPRDQALNLSNLTSSYLEIGDFGKARETFEESLKLSREMGYRITEGVAVLESGWWSVLQGRWRKHARFEDARQLGDTVANPQLSQEAREGLGFVSLHRNDLTEARDLIEAANKYSTRLANHRTQALLGTYVSGRVIYMRREKPFRRQSRPPIICWLLQQNGTRHTKHEVWHPPGSFCAAT